MESNKTSKLISFLANVKIEALETEKDMFAGYGNIAAAHNIDLVITKLVTLDTEVADQKLLIEILKAELDEYHDKYGEITYEDGDSNGN